MLGIEGRRAIIIPNARIDDVSVAPGSILVSPPGPLPQLGLMNKLEMDIRQAGIIGDEMAFESVSMIVHAFEVAPGHRRIPPEMRGEGKSQSGAMIDDPSGYLCCTLVIQTIGVDDLTLLEEIRFFLERNIKTYRLSGGRIIESGVRQTSGDMKNPFLLRRVESASGQKNLLRILRMLPPGSVLSDQTQLLSDESNPDDKRDHLDRLLDLICVRKRQAASQKDGQDSIDGRTEENAMESEWYKSHKGRFVPVNIGFRALSEMKMREGMRKGEGVLGHVWVEDVVGVARWISMQKAFREKGFTPGVFWSYDICEPEGPYLASGK